MGVAEMRSTNNRRRAVVGRVRVVLFCMTLMTASLAITPRSVIAQEVDTTIAFLNPSSFAATPAGIIVSDRQPMRPETGDETYRLSAWVHQPPVNPAVEFELLRSGISLA